MHACMRAYIHTCIHACIPIYLPTYDELQETYCTNATSKCYRITGEYLRNVASKMPNNKAPGRDKLVSYCLKYLTPLHSPLKSLLQQANQNTLELPDIPKNVHTHVEKNYRPIACLNTSYKLFTGFPNILLDDHCTSNSIITVEQAGGKKGSLGCTDQLLMNKMLLDEVREYRRNLLQERV